MGMKKIFAVRVGAAAFCLAAVCSVSVAGNCSGGYKFPAVNQRNMKSAERLISCALETGSRENGVWWAGTGLLGSSMVPRNPYEAYELFMGYSSLFETGLQGVAQTKLEAAASGQYAVLLALSDLKTKTWMSGRERFLALAGITLREQYVYGQEGTYGRVIARLPVHQNLPRLANALTDAFDLYLFAKEKGLDDATLGDAVGLSAAFLKFRGVFPPDFTLDREPGEQLPYSQPVYDEVFAGVLADLEKEIPLFYSLKDRMAVKGLVSDDVLAWPAEKQKSALLRIVETDFSRFKKRPLAGVAY